MMPFLALVYVFIGAWLMWRAFPPPATLPPPPLVLVVGILTYMVAWPLLLVWSALHIVMAARQRRVRHE